MDHLACTHRVDRETEYDTCKINTSENVAEVRASEHRETGANGLSRGECDEQERSVGRAAAYSDLSLKHDGLPSRERVGTVAVPTAGETLFSRSLSALVPVHDFHSP